MKNTQNCGKNQISLVIWFYLWTFGLSWAIFLPGMLNGLQWVDWGFTTGVYNLLNIMGGFIPSTVGIILIFRKNHKEGLKNVFKSLLPSKNHSVIWYFGSFLLIPSIQGVVFLGCYLVRLDFEVPPLIYTWWLIPLYYLAQYLPFGNGFREEFGWRGFAQPQLQSQITPIFSSMLNGFIWGIWHFPLRYFPTAREIYDYIPFWLFICNTIAYSVLIGWFYNQTTDKMFIAITLHGAMNVSGTIFMLHLIPNAQIIVLGCIILIDVLLYALSRKNSANKELDENNY